MNDAYVKQKGNAVAAFLGDSAVLSLSNVMLSAGVAFAQQKLRSTGFSAGQSKAAALPSLDLIFDSEMIRFLVCRHRQIALG